MADPAQAKVIDGKYAVVRFVGAGAWATVYEGVHLRIQRRVAIKVLNRDVASKPGVVERFEREAQAATRVQSDHVVDVFDFGTLPDGRPYIVMEFLDGVDLAQRLKDGPLEEHHAVRYAVQALVGLADAHAAGVFHRDIKPDNVVLVQSNKTGTELVKIVDFGISKLHSGAQVTSLTQTNAVVGSPVYMSPEQCRGARQMDHRSDIYSFGVVLYEALTGEVPHTAASFNELMFTIALEDAPDPRKFKPNLDPGLVAIVMKALAREPTERYQDAHAFRDALLDWASSKGLTMEQARRSSVKEHVRLALEPEVAFRGPHATTAPPPEPSTAAVEREVAAPKTAGARDSERPRSSKRTVTIGAALVVLTVGAIVAARALNGKPSALPEATTARRSSDTAAPSTPTVAPTGAPSAAPTTAATEVEAPRTAAVASTAPASIPTTPRGRAPGQGGVPRFLAAPSATSAVTAEPPPPPSAPAPTASEKGTVDGRTIHTTF